MRVLHVNKYLYRKGGAEGYMEDTAALQVKAGHEVGFWGMAHPDNTHTALADTFVSEVDFESPPPGVVGRAKVVGRMLWSTSARAGSNVPLSGSSPTSPTSTTCTTSCRRPSSERWLARTFPSS